MQLILFQTKMEAKLSLTGRAFSKEDLAASILQLVLCI
jgi:hypothetical protein